MTTRPPSVATFKHGSQPLVLSGGGNITAKANGAILFEDPNTVGQDFTAISSGDSVVHDIILDGGRLDFRNPGQLFLGTGAVVKNNGFLDVAGTAPLPGPPGLLHFVGSDGLTVSTGGGVRLTQSANLSFDGTAQISDSTSRITVEQQSTLTVGANAMSPQSVLNGGLLDLQGTLVAHGGLNLFAGVLTTHGSLLSTINVDAGNTVWLDGSEIDVTLNGKNAKPGDAQGMLTINGRFYATAGTIVDMVERSGGFRDQGTLVVNGDMSLTTSATFYSRNLNTAALPSDWTLLKWTGARTGSFTFDTGLGLGATWDDTLKILTVNE